MTTLSDGDGRKNDTFGGVPSRKEILGGGVWKVFWCIIWLVISGLVIRKLMFLVLPYSFGFSLQQAGVVLVKYLVLTS